jgi:hypothetical protein
MRRRMLFSCRRPVDPSIRGLLADALVVVLEPDPDEAQARELAGVAVDEPHERLDVVAQPQPLRRPQRTPVDERIQLLPGDLGLAEVDVDADLAQPPSSRSAQVSPSMREVLSS